MEGVLEQIVRTTVIESRAIVDLPDGSMVRCLRQFVAVNRKLCRAVDRCLPERLSVDGNRHFTDVVVPRYTRPGSVVIDVGGGKTPFFSVEKKNGLGLCVIGLDVTDSELSRAPAGAYDVAVVGDICASPLATSADLIVCMTVIEHVESAERAIEAMAKLMRPNGVIALLVPCRNAMFARLNRLLPEGFKRRLLAAIYPETHDLVGFTAYYDRCTPSGLEQVARAAGLRVVGKEIYNWSGYFDFFFPFYVCWRIVSLLAVAIFGADAADRFCLLLARTDAVPLP